MKSGIKYFFWGCFAAFLLASIPHVAYFFRAYEPAAAGPGDNWYWCVSYAIAVSIDITIFLLSVTVANMQRDKKPGGLVFSVWVFILALAALSWFINYKYAIHFVETGMISATPVNIAGYNLGDINPLIASMFQIMAIAYTWISDKIFSDVQEKTAVELQAEAKELKLAAAAREEIATIKRGQRVNAFKGLIDAGADVTKHVASQLTGPAKDNQEVPAGDSEQQSKERDTDKLTAIKDVSIVSEQGQENNNQSSQESGETGPEITTEHPALVGLSGRATLPIEQVASIIQCEIKYVQTLRNKGTLKHAAKSKELITVASLKSYLAGRRKPRQSPVIEQPTEKLTMVG